MKIALLRAKSDVIRLAAELMISPGIVAGRFQRLAEKWNYFNWLKRRFEWVVTNNCKSSETTTSC